ncbi:PrsW family intramembrane metalloprotease [Peribacillus huizhouensis]|uniref:RsiW-degrading membrane proteinase PrsW (M82 family) n=1 Tax=Peribacillus huizhouensis TaxID=1501239 RepID=A0ABR6CL18_9BACI|nr:PrsW family glutamic-type intramembrane protease [Peribacillus huizhouensis]MBA9025748.1 RsiW-degrading membrane proteinase PrsW (M82 family) [Peribacillus huizhouensis]
MNSIWSIRTGIRDFLEAIYRTCQSWIAKYPFIKTAYAIFSWLSLLAFVLSLFFVKESRTMMIQYLWSFYVLLQFWFLCRSKTMPWKQVVLFVLAGVFLVVPFTTLTVNAFHVLFGGKTSDTWSIAVITPIFEELWKLLPLGIFLLFSRRASAMSLSDYTLIGAATGVGFQLMEELSRRWLNPGAIDYSTTMFGGKMIHWDFWTLFPGRFEASFLPTLMTVSHPVHTAMVALACGIAYRLRKRLTKWVFLFPAILLLWSILDHMANNGQLKLPDWVFRLHDWTGSGYKTQPVFLLMLVASIFADYWSLNKIRNRLPSLPNEPLLNPFIELWNITRSFCLDRGKFIYWLGFYRERRELGFHLLYGNEEAAGRQEAVQARVKTLCQALTGLAVILLVASLFADIGAHTGGGETACFACLFDSLQNWWDRLEWYEQGAIVLGALALSLLFVGFWPALGIAMTGASIAGSGHEIAGYIRDPKKMLTPENALSVAVGIVLSRIPFGKALKWAGKKGRRYLRKLLDKLGSRKPDIDVPVHPKPPKNAGPGKHQDGPKKPDEDPKKPDDGPKKPDEDPKKPDDGSKKPDEDPKKPDDNPKKSDDDTPNKDKADEGTEQDKTIGNMVKVKNKTKYTNPAGNELTWVDQSPKNINIAINQFLNSKDVGKATEAKVADFVRNKTEVKVKAYAQKVEKSDGQFAGDLDVVTKDAIIEVKTSIRSVKVDQFNKFTDPTHDLFFNPENKKVILYIDKSLSNLRPEQKAMLETIKSKGVTIVNSLEDLKGVL